MTAEVASGLARRPSRAVLWLVALGVVVALALGASALWGPSVRVEVVNVGGTPLHDVVVRVTGNQYSLGSLASREEQRTTVQAEGESHVEVDWRTPGSQDVHTAVVDCYFEAAAYDGLIRVELNGSAMVTSSADVGMWP